MAHWQLTGRPCVAVYMLCPCPEVDGVVVGGPPAWALLGMGGGSAPGGVLLGLVLAPEREPGLPMTFCLVAQVQIPVQIAQESVS